MPFDPNKLTIDGDSESIVDPRDIFASLPAKDPKFSYLRDVQAQVLEAWLERRTERDLIVKLNTGSGKTLVALLMLKSSLNEGVGPAVYLAPDKYLVAQAREEADQLGISHASEPNDHDFLQGRSILIDTFASLFNGKSVFGVKSRGVRVPIGTLVIDDAHACLEKLEDQFTLRVDAGTNSALYEGLVKLFERDIAEQSPARAAEIVNKDPRVLLPIPYWAWQKRHNEVIKLFTKHAEEFPFPWPLLKDDLQFCQAVVSGGAFEVAPFCVPIDHIRSYAGCRRRIFLSATLARDGILVTDFNVSGNATANPLSPTRVDDIGDRMVLIPQQLNHELSDDELVAFVAQFAAKKNVVVIVPSEVAAKKWASVSKMTLKADTIYSGVEQLRQGHVGLVVFINKYDGVDLPHEACRLLVIDDIPAARRLVDIYSDSLVEISDDMVGRRVQRVEQGMGRGVRSNSDYCAVLLMGRRLVETVSSPLGLSKFSPATGAQMQLASLVAKQLKDSSLDDLENALAMFFRRDRTWVEKSKAAVVRSGRFRASPPDQVAIARRAAFDQGSVGFIDQAEKEFSAVISAQTPIIKGILLQEKAAYVNSIDAPRAQILQQEALKSNRYVMRPRQGFQYEKIGEGLRDQGEVAARYWNSFADVSQALMHFHAVLANLVFDPDTADRFEDSVSHLAAFIGFVGQRPEKETGSGPDVLWALPAGKFVLIECKNGAVTQFVSKSDCDQIGGSLEWFTARYGDGVEVESIMIHPSRYFGRQASPRANVRVLERQSMETLIAALNTVAKSVGALNEKLTAAWIATILASQGLTSGEFTQKFTLKFKEEASAPKK